MDALLHHDPLWLLGLLGALVVTGCVAGLLAGLLGVGGGIVVVPMLYYLFGSLGVDEAVRMHLTVGTSLAAIIPTSFMSFRAHDARGNLDRALLRRWAVPLLLGSLAGILVSALVAGQVLTGLFAAVAVLVALHMALGSRPGRLGQQLPGTPWNQLMALVIAGFSTLMGIGGGTLSVPALNAFNYPMHRAVGTAAGIGMLISLPGALGFLWQGWQAPSLPPLSLGYVNLAGVALIVPLTMLVAPLGVRLAGRLDARHLQRLFALFLLLTSARMVADLL
ncbi:sulfite exporter TauE/SafE family protein [Isoalcanivorax beigongshangi]|uniref:Probable membrane transporter protein n=1 Tax=Isoalcanivorax beigongshangi TaxID=3238810 RepID=A0ABV4AEB3_9GAMM